MLIIVNSVIMAIEFEYQGLVESVVCCETLHVLSSENFNVLCRPGYVVGHDLDYRRMEGSPDEAAISVASILKHRRLPGALVRHSQVCECRMQIFCSYIHFVQAWPHADSAFYAINLGFTIAFVAAEKHTIRRTVEPVAVDFVARGEVTG